MKISRYRSALMGVAALWIWYFHCGMTLFANQKGGLHDVAWYIKNFGFCGVDMFLLLSSMGLYYHFSKTEIYTAEDYIKYLARRFSKIYKVFFPATVMFALIKNWPFREFILNLITYNNFAHYVYSHLWFVSCILLFYIWAPALFMCIKYQKHYILISVVIVILEIALIVGVQKYVRQDLFLIINRIPVFTLGFCVGRLEYDNTWNKRAGYGVACLSLIISLICTYYIESGKILSMMHSPVLFTGIGVAFGTVACIPLALSAIEKMNIGKYFIRTLVFYGMISFEFYCYQEKIDAYVFKNMDSIIIDIMSLALSTCVAYMAHYIATNIDIKVIHKNEFNQ